MYLKNVKIQNFGSLKDISFSGQPLVVLVGQNGQGKSHIFEALHRFFIDFNPIGGSASAGVTDMLWYRRDTKNPISFEILIELKDDEIKKLFPFKEDIFKISNEESEKNNSSSLLIKRSLSSEGAWKTEQLTWGNIPLITNDSIISPEKFVSHILPNSFFKKFKVYFFTAGNSKENVGGDRLLLDSEKNKIYSPNSFIDELVRRGFIDSSMELAGKNAQEWSNEKGLPINPLTPEDFPEFNLITPELLQQTMNSLSNLRGKFKLIPASRDSKATLGQRSSLLDSDILLTITATSIDRQRTAEMKWERYRSYVEKILGKRLDPNPNQFLIKEGDLGLQPSQMGGGEQVVMGLIWETIDINAIVAIEEPENHMHPGLQRKLLKHFQDLSSETQILISTHSPIFASKPTIDGIFHVFKDEQGTTKVESINETNINRLIEEMGVRPSDIFEFENIVFVEGDDDVKIFKSISLALSKNSHTNVGFIDAEGWRSMAYYVNARVLRSKNIKVNIFAIFDGDTELGEKQNKIKERLIKELSIDENHIMTLKQNSIEGYLLVPPAIKRAFPQFKLSEKEIEKFFKDHQDKKNKKEVLNLLFKRGGIYSFNGDMSVQIIQAMHPDEIDIELKNIIEKFHASSQ
jgi:predicted ATPase